MFRKALNNSVFGFKGPSLEGSKKPLFIGFFDTPQFKELK